METIKSPLWQQNRRQLYDAADHVLLRGEVEKIESMVKRIWLLYGFTYATSWKLLTLPYPCLQRFSNESCHYKYAYFKKGLGWKEILGSLILLPRNTGFIWTSIILEIREGLGRQLQMLWVSKGIRGPWPFWWWLVPLSNSGKLTIVLWDTRNCLVVFTIHYLVLFW